MTTPNPSTERNWREIVEKADDDNRHIESHYPVVYYFSGNVRKRDSGPNSGVYNPDS